MITGIFHFPGQVLRRWTMKLRIQFFAAGIPFHFEAVTLSWAIMEGPDPSCMRPSFT